VTFLWISKTRCSSKNLSFINKVVSFLFSTYFISMHNNK
jgi:hypothetical protein